MSFSPSLTPGATPMADGRDVHATHQLSSGLGYVHNQFVDDRARLTEAFRHDEWLSHYKLTEQSVLDYFAFSPFYQWDCINEMRKLPNFDDKQAEGIEYAVKRTGQEPDLFVVQRLLRGREGTVAVLTLYYCLRGTIYQSPDLQTLVHARLEKAAGHVAAAAEALRLERAATSSSIAKSGIGAAGDAPASASEGAFRAALDEALRLMSKDAAAPG